MMPRMKAAWYHRLDIVSLFLEMIERVRYSFLTGVRGGRTMGECRLMFGIDQN